MLHEEAHKPLRLLLIFAEMPLRMPWGWRDCHVGLAVARNKEAMEAFPTIELRQSPNSRETMRELGYNSSHHDDPVDKDLDVGVSLEARF